MLALVGLVCTAAASVAHEGHDHGPAPAPLPAATKPRVAVQTEAFELVIEILTGSDSVKPEPRPDGSYRAAVPAT